MTEDERESLTEQLAELDAAMERIEASRKPFDDAISAINGVREALLEKHDADVIGHCEGCNRLLLDGDQGHVGEDCTLCLECAPTWDDLRDQYLRLLEEEPGDEIFQEGFDAADGYVKAGRGAEKHVWELG